MRSGMGRVPEKRGTRTLPDRPGNTGESAGHCKLGRGSRPSVFPRPRRLPGLARVHRRGPGLDRPGAPAYLPPLCRDREAGFRISGRAAMRIWLGGERGATPAVPRGGGEVRPPVPAGPGDLAGHYDLTVGLPDPQHVAFAAFVGRLAEAAGAHGLSWAVL